MAHPLQCDGPWREGILPSQARASALTSLNREETPPIGTSKGAPFGRVGSMPSPRDPPNRETAPGGEGILPSHAPPGAVSSQLRRALGSPTQTAENGCTNLQTPTTRAILPPNSGSSSSANAHLSGTRLSGRRLLFGGRATGNVVVRGGEGDGKCRGWGDRRCGGGRARRRLGRSGRGEGNGGYWGGIGAEAQDVVVGADRRTKKTPNFRFASRPCVRYAPCLRVTRLGGCCTYNSRLVPF